MPNMTGFFVGFWFAFIGASFAVIGAPTPTPMAHFHSIGSQQLSADTNANKLKTIWNLRAAPELKNGQIVLDAKGKQLFSQPTHQLMDKTMAKLGRLPSFIYASKFGENADNSTWVKPLLDDLITYESCGDYDANDRQWSWTLAIRITEERSALWSNNLSSMLKVWHFGVSTNIQIEGLSGWEFRQNNGPVVFRYVRAGSWCLLGMGSDSLPRLAAMAVQIKSAGRPKLCEAEGFLSGFVDIARLAPRWPMYDYLPFLPLDRNPSISFQLTSKSDFVGTKAILHYPNAPVWNFEPWKLPTNTIKDPIIGFTAVQGIGAWLERQPNLKQIQIRPLPNQACLWSFNLPFASYLAFPMPQAPEFVSRVAARLIPSIATNLASAQLGEMKYGSNKLNWTVPALELIHPALAPISEPIGPFVLASLIPVPVFPDPAPAELFHQIVGRTNLLYYDWEFTQQRAMQERLIIGHAFDLFHPPATPNASRDNTNHLANAWLNTAYVELGNTVTEAELTSPWDVTIKRSSQLGLSGLEIVLLTRWLDSPDFPWPGVQGPSAPKPAAKPAK